MAVKRDMKSKEGTKYMRFKDVPNSLSLYLVQGHVTHRSRELITKLTSAYPNIIHCPLDGVRRTLQ